MKGDFRLALVVLIDRLCEMEGMAASKALEEWDELRGSDWVAATTNDPSPWDRPTHGYVIVNGVTGARYGQVYSSKGGAKSSYNHRSEVRWHGAPKFDDQTEYLLKRLVIADE